MRRISIRMDDELADEVALLAEAQGQSVNALVVGLLRTYVSRVRSDDRTKEAVARKLRETAERFGIDMSDAGG